MRLMARRLQGIFWLKHGDNVAVLSQIGLTTQAEWRHVTFFLCFLFAFESVANMGIDWV